MTEAQKTFADQKRKTVETAEFTEDGRYKRKVRSFVLRTGRLSDFQKNMMNDHWADLGLSLFARLDANRWWASVGAFWFAETSRDRGGFARFFGCRKRKVKTDY